MFFAAQIVRAQWVLFSEAAGVPPHNAGEISQMETGECMERCAQPPVLLSSPAVSPSAAEGRRRIII